MTLSLHRAPTGFGQDRPTGVGRVYAVALEFDAQRLEEHYPNRSWRNAYRDLGRFFDGLDFENKYGTFYVSPEGAGPVECILAVQDLAKLYAWFTPSLKHIRLVRIEEDVDLMPAIDRKHRPERA